VVRLGDSATAARDRLLEARDATRTAAAGSARSLRTSA
jgi:hypothetical protein